MATEQNVQERRRYQHRGRRGPERRGGEPRTSQHAQEARNRGNVDVEQIMRDIRSRIARQHGVELTNDQIQELAARRIEAILDPRGLPPALMEQLRRSAGAPPPAPSKPFDAAGTALDEEALYGSANGLLRFLRRLFRPLLTLLMNPQAVVRAQQAQSQFNAEIAAREAERDRHQAEWNALHYEILQRLVTEVSRVSLEMQSLSLRIESLAAKVDFNERRVRSMEQPTPAKPRAAEPVVAVGPIAVDDGGAIGAPEQGAPTTEGPRRKRRRRRGRRGGGAAGEAVTIGATPAGDEVDSGEPIEGLDAGTDEIDELDSSDRGVEPSDASVEPLPQGIEPAASAEERATDPFAVAEAARTWEPVPPAEPTVQTAPEPERGSEPGTTEDEDPTERPPTQTS